MKLIPLSRGMFAKVDDEDFDWVNQWKWSVQSGESKYLYASRGVGSRNNQKTILMHRSILNAPQGTHVDHIDHDGLNNQRSNLRLCDRSQNMMNRKVHKNNSTGVKGVNWRPKLKKYEVRIQAHKIPYYLGYYSTIEEAKQAYNKASERLHKEFAKLNE